MSKYFSQILSYKFERYEENFIRRKYILGICYFYSCYNLSCSLLGLKEDARHYKKLDKLWKKMLLSSGNARDKYFKKLKDMINKDMEIIIKAMDYLTKLNKQMPIQNMNMFPDDVIGILTYEYKNL